MNAEQLEAKLQETPASTPISAPLLSSVAGALGDLDAYARSYGRAKGLEREGGTFVCWQCQAPLEPFHVSLHCEWCLDQAIQKERAAQAWLDSLSPGDRLWIDIAERIEAPRGMTRDAAVRLLDNAKQRPDAAPHRLAWADAAFDKRFGQMVPARNVWVPEGEPDWRDR